jgi:Lrp/AsnC family transcriptional regulator
MVKLDAIDRRILGQLQQDARMSNADLAEKVGLSASPCWRRVKRLEEEGVIRRHVTLLDADRLGLGVSVFVRVTLEKHTSEHRKEFEDVVLRHDEVMECYSMTGSQDYLLRCVVRDIGSYEKFLSETIMHIPAVASVNSSFALKQIKYSTALPLSLTEG